MNKPKKGKKETKTEEYLRRIVELLERQQFIQPNFTVTTPPQTQNVCRICGSIVGTFHFCSGSGGYGQTNII